MASRSNSSIDGLIAVFDVFYQSVSESKHSDLIALRSDWVAGKAKIVEALSNKSHKAPISAITSGLKQGLRELPQILARLTDDERTAASASLHKAISEHYPSYFTKEHELLLKAKNRGAINTENEYNSVRFLVDCYEGEGGHEEDVEELHKLLDAYEAKS